MQKAQVFLLEQEKACVFEWNVNIINCLKTPYMYQLELQRKKFWENWKLGWVKRTGLKPFLFLPRKTMGTKPASGRLLLFFTTCHTFENIFYIVSSLDKQILIQVSGSTLLHELIFLWFVGHFYVAFTENSLKWIIFEKPVGFYNSLVLFPIRVIYSTAILSQGRLGALTSNKLWLLSCKARQCETVGRARGSRLKSTRCDQQMISLLWNPGFVTIKHKRWWCLLRFS